MINDLRNTHPKILVAGNHTKIIQSILDFDYASGKDSPSVIGIVSAGRKSQKVFWGDREVLLPVFATVENAKNADFKPDFLLCITSASSTPRMVEAFFTAFPEARGAHLFAEGVAERDALQMIDKYGRDKLIAGASGVGLCIPGTLKLGAIGGVLGPRVTQLGKEYGSTAVICSSGGMVNELMYQVVAAGSAISFAACYGGDRFPVTSPLQWMIEAENDPQTEAIVYFGELGGNDEYVLRDAIKDKNITKPVYAYIAGRYSSEDENIQFGHAKALAKEEEDTAQAKMVALREVGVHVADTFNDFMALFKDLSSDVVTVKSPRAWESRSLVTRGTLFSSPKFEHQSEKTPYTQAILERILQKTDVSHETVAFADLVFAQLIDHGPHVSGAVNTMITARAGKDMSAALASGVLTVGDRFGGAINGAAAIWHEAVARETLPETLVQEYSARREYILGIGHKKYSVYKPDPRVRDLVAHGTNVLRETPHLDFAQGIAEITSKKRANLILNVDGAISALFMDFLLEKEHYSPEQIRELIDAEFFNALFLIPRSVGFVGNFLDQKRIDEGLFRLSDDDVFEF